MTQNQILLAVGIWAVLMVICYSHSGWRNMRDCYMMWFTREYWTNYNTLEFVSWVAKAIIIIPGLRLLAGNIGSNPDAGKSL